MAVVVPGPNPVPSTEGVTEACRSLLILGTRTQILFCVNSFSPPSLLLFTEHPLCVSHCSKGCLCCLIFLLMTAL